MTEIRPKVRNYHVLELHRDNPEWCAAQIAEKLGCRPEYVRATISRAKLGLVKIKRKPGMQSTWTQPEIERLIHLRDVEQMTWRQIAKAMGRPIGTCTYQYSQVESANISPKRDPVEKIYIPDGLMADAARRNLAERSLTAQFFGDPAPGQSALDKKQGAFA